ncbi:nuclear protein localization protein 4 (NPL4) [Vairimorpha necatrix]|uniref:Nuclear protein localization protein 4 n=1 Tax=Vairimorpha necatrix TaxID=6039 RepID=A0AAX4JAW9_9MICR
MIIFIKGPTERKRLEINSHDKLYKKVQEAFNIESFNLSYDEDNQNKIDEKSTIPELNLKQGMTLYLHYEIIKKDIKREKDDFMCDHASNAMCAHCAPLDPWDAKYLEDKKIKYLSYNSYKEMCKYKNQDFIMEDYSVKKCTDHNRNIRCVNCQEKDILLNPQRYRMVDHVEFDDSNMVQNFIRNWRDTRRQYFGILIGKYKNYDLVPLGRKALVSGIWIPEQENYPDGFVINDKFEDDFLLDTGLEILGMIYTDLIFDGQMTSSKMKDDLFLSSLEVDFISKMQFMFPNFENNQLLNSKFVTIVATSNQNNEIELMEYQVSSQCMALTRNNLILPTSNPKLFYTEKNIFYKILQEDGTLKNVKAEPFLPVEYFIVRLTHGNKQNPLFLNSDFINNTISNKKLAEYFNEEYSIEKFSNFNLLMKLKNRFRNFNKFLKCIIEKNQEDFDKFLQEEEFQNFILELKKYFKKAWVCKACTFINEQNLERCEVCETANI